MPSLTIAYDPLFIGVEFEYNPKKCFGDFFSDLINPTGNPKNRTSLNIFSQ